MACVIGQYTSRCQSATNTSIGPSRMRSAKDLPPTTRPGQDTPRAVVAPFVHRAAAPPPAAPAAGLRAAERGRGAGRGRPGNQRRRDDGKRQLVPAAVPRACQAPHRCRSMEGSRRPPGAEGRAQSGRAWGTSRRRAPGCAVRASGACSGPRPAARTCASPRSLGSQAQSIASTYASRRSQRGHMTAAGAPQAQVRGGGGERRTRRRSTLRR